MPILRGRKYVPGTRYGRFVVVGVDPRPDYLIVKCDCGAKKSVCAHSLRRGKSRSCGCLHRESVAARQKTHGLSCSPEYKAWVQIKSRCLNPKHPGFADYGGRGITISPEWANNFAAFFACVGKRPSDIHSIDRIDNHGNYEPGNVKWSTQSQQNQNTRRNRNITFNGVTLCAYEWSKRLGIPNSTIKRRNDLGLSPEKVLAKKEEVA